MLENVKVAPNNSLRNDMILDKSRSFPKWNFEMLKSRLEILANVAEIRRKLYIPTYQDLGCPTLLERNQNNSKFHLEGGPTMSCLVIVMKLSKGMMKMDRVRSFKSKRLLGLFLLLFCTILIFQTGPILADELDDQFLTDLVTSKQFNPTSPIVAEKFRFQCALIYLAATEASKKITSETAQTDFTKKIEGKTTELEAATIAWWSLAVDRAIAEGLNAEELGKAYGAKWTSRYTVGAMALLFNKQDRGQMAGAAEFAENDFTICEAMFDHLKKQ